MSTYKELQGITIQSLTSDPSNTDNQPIWYNSTTARFKVKALTTTGTWATGGTMGTARFKLYGVGTQTAGLGFGGYEQYYGFTDATEEYDGSSWTAGGVLNTFREYLAGAGTQTAGLGFGGYGGPEYWQVDVTEEYNGSSWTASGSMGTARSKLAGAGTQTACLLYTSPSPRDRTRSRMPSSA